MPLAMDKTCPMCGKSLPSTAEYFHLRGASRPGQLQSRCKTCARETMRVYVAPPASPGQMKTCSKCNRRLPAAAEFFARERQGKYGLTSHCLECKRADGQASYIKHHEARLEAHAAYRAGHREEMAAYGAEWRRANPEAVRVYRHTHKARKRGNGGSHTVADVRAQYERQHGRCFWCQKKVDSYHVDHVVPVSKGGGNGPANLVITCPHCNMSKQDKHPMDFAGVLL